MPKPEEIPQCPDTPRFSSLGRITREYEIEIVTPLFGGGVEAGAVDNYYPIRETAIRGHLRFWWRLAIGHKLGAGMWQREEEVFGTTDFPSPLVVRVLEQPPSIKLADPTYGDRFGPIAYALFPAVQNVQKVGQDRIRFRLYLAWDRAERLKASRAAQNELRRRSNRRLLPDTIEDISNDIETALRAWITYGGLGARTRRGCGAVHCPELVGFGLPPITARVFLGKQKQNTSLEAWKAALEVYRDFRQKHRGPVHAKVLRNGRTVNVPGRTYWPEADSIRKITGCALRMKGSSSSTDVQNDQNLRDHSTPIVPKELLPAFPRAIFGLPINFHFADGPVAEGPNKKQKADPNADPKDVRLLPVLPDKTGEMRIGERMASPVITRPLWFKGGWYPAVIILEQHLPSAFALRLQGELAQAGGGNLEYDLSLDRVVNPAFGKLRPMYGHASALEAFIEYLRARAGFREVIL